MLNIVIKFDKEKGMYNIYEESTNTLMVSCNLVEALCNLNEFLLSSGLIQGDFIHSDNIQYHLDSNTMKSIIEGNLALVKRLNNAPSGFMISEQRFGQGMATSNSNSKDYEFTDKYEISKPRKLTEKEISYYQRIKSKKMLTQLKKVKINYHQN